MVYEEAESEAWWNAKFLIAECLRKQGHMAESRDVATELGRHPLTVSSEALSARVATLAAFALQGSGHLADAIQSARQAVETAASQPDHANIAIEARNALIAALAESGQLEEAWDQSVKLVELLEREPYSTYAGQSYWAIGNVAFLLKRIDDGVTYHQLAADSLSPTNDLDLWARFNRGSAQFRLSAGLSGPETLACIERAELASSIVGGTARDQLELRLNRAQWMVLIGQSQGAVAQLKSIVEQRQLLAPQIAAQAYLLLGEAIALSGLGDKAEATTNLELSEELFLQSGAEDRAAAARELIESLRRPE
ncbi:hypothetical protein [uncultured Arthrobacter sp.]|uniref:hypothetical protein n=1 Tax=uncultured Arthrobacter sp. TaxID=114050 RepID=UPI0026158D39|nr:hypothetical protein [uncultured Arthrobacter sp.]